MFFQNSEIGSFTRTTTASLHNLITIEDCLEKMKRSVELSHRVNNLELREITGVGNISDRQRFRASSMQNTWLDYEAYKKYMSAGDHKHVAK